MTQPFSSLRAALRDDLRAEHDRLDAAMGRLELTHPAGLGVFLSCHWRVWSALSPQGAEAQEALARRTEALERDLAALSRPAPRSVPVRVHDTAALYMALGASLGTTVLRRKWETGTAPLTRAAHHFFTLPTDSARWRDLCQKLSACDAQSALGRAVLKDARLIYGLFDAALAQNSLISMPYLPVYQRTTLPAAA